MVEQVLSRGTILAEVAVDIAARQLSGKLFTYRVPDYLVKDTFVGSQVLVPFGGQELVSGFVVGLKEIADGAKPDFAQDVNRIKDIAELVDHDPLFDSAYIDFLYWLADYYSASLSAVIAAAVPADFAPRLKRVVKLQEVANQNVPSVLLDLLKSAKDGSLALNALRQRSGLTRSEFFKQLSNLRRLNYLSVESEATQVASPKLITVVKSTGVTGGTKRQAEILSVLSRQGGQMEMAKLQEAAVTTGSTIKKLAELGFVTITKEEVLRDPMQLVEESASFKSQSFDLTENQKMVLQVLSEDLHSRSDVGHGSGGDDVLPWLLHGVTGSGKTEIYLRLIQQALDMGKSAMLLVPEISLTPQLAERLKSRFAEKVSVWHSALSPGERYDTWRRLRAGDVKVLLGARSAILTNMPKLGLMILDEEHDNSYKQSSPAPRYHAKQVAIEKARRTGAMLLLGSATPDVVSFQEAKNSKRLLELPERVHKQVMPEVSLVDMRQEFSQGNRGIFSKALITALEGCLERKEQAILLINRRGYASYVQCQACGDVTKCRNCSVSMVLHRQGFGSSKNGYLACHHCGLSVPFTVTCSACQAPFLREYGLGTQKVEMELRDIFTEARLLRLDSDVAQKRGAYQAIFKQFSRGEADILIGTQMVSKGLDIANVTLVGVLSADAAFNLPDYRTVERGFQLLTQVAGRAGRGLRPGSVIMQTYNPEMPVLAWAKGHDYQSFVTEELKSRSELEYPPFSQLVRLVITGSDLRAVESFADEIAEELAKYLEDLVSDTSIKVLGPTPCLIEMLKQNYRYQLIVKNMLGDEGRVLIGSFLKNKKVNPNVSLAIDVDAYDFV